MRYGNELDRLADSLKDRKFSHSAEEPQAAVAAVLTEDANLLFIHRIAYDGDPWSGHLAFPGGRIEDSDTLPRKAAERETVEEVGLDLSEALSLGRLQDITGSTIPLCVSCHVFGIDALPDLQLNEEVDDAFTVKLSELADRANWVEADFEIKGETKPYPAIDLKLDGKPLLWGLTYRFVVQLLEHAGLINDD
ncbi:MAG: CoA pyrophosphatase [Candidatus Latescibacterota bacterium]|nr:CoA pyrophosphatase [Candidatus Latescibacterota bacterium]